MCVYVCVGGVGEGGGNTTIFFVLLHTVARDVCILMCVVNVCTIFSLV